MMNVRELRRRYGLTRRQFCEIFEIPYRTVQSWELGLRPCPEYLFRMAEMLLYLSDMLGGLEAFQEEEKKK